MQAVFDRGHAAGAACRTNPLRQHPLCCQTQHFLATSAADRESGDVYWTAAYVLGWLSGYEGRVLPEVARLLEKLAEKERAVSKAVSLVCWLGRTPEEVPAHLIRQALTRLQVAESAWGKALNHLLLERYRVTRQGCPLCQTAAEEEEAWLLAKVVS